MACASAASLVSKVEISVSCRHLADMDTLSKSDPMCVLFVCPPGTDRFREHGRTEMLLNTLDPDFHRKFIVDFHFEEHQRVQFKIYDIDSGSSKLEDHDFLGQLDTSLGELVSRRRFETQLAKSPKRGSTITVTCLELQHCKEVLSVSISGQKLDKKDFFGKSDPYIEIYKPLNELLVVDPSEIKRAQWTLAHRSETLMSTLNPMWQPFTVKLSNLCNANKDLILKFRCMDWNKRSKHSLIGEFYASLQQLLNEAAQSGNKTSRTLTSRKGKPAGSILFERMQIIIEDTFIDYIQGGCELDFTVAIDFTASNRNPNQPESLHYFGNNHTTATSFLSQYEQAIMSIGEIVQDYNSTRAFPAMGFGAKVPPSGQLSHCFPLNFNWQNPNCYGLQDLLMTYRRCVQSVTLYGPTNFSPIIEQVMEQASSDRSGKKFWVLLIITDGCITDLYETKNCIVQASRLPMAIIIVGVGNEDFSAMEELDSDDKRLQVNGKVAEADIVQFVPLHDFQKNGQSNEMSKSSLAKAVLDELPDQLCSWMRRHGIQAGPPRERPVEQGYQPSGQEGQPPPYQTPPQGCEPLPGQGQQPLSGQGYQPLPGQGYQPLSGQGYQPLPGQGYQPLPGQGYQPIPGQGYQPLPGQGYQPPPVQEYQVPTGLGYQPSLAQGYQVPTGLGYQPSLAQGYQPPLGHGHQTPPAKRKNLTESNEAPDEKVPTSLSDGPNNSPPSAASQLDPTSPES